MDNMCNLAMSLLKQ